MCELWVVDDPKLASVVSSKSSSDNRSINQAVCKTIDVSRVQRESGFAQIDKCEKYLALENGVLTQPTDRHQLLEHGLRPVGFD